MIIVKHLAEREWLKGEKKIPHNPSTQKIATANMWYITFQINGFAQKHTLF